MDFSRTEEQRSIVEVTRSFVERERQQLTQDEEQFRLITGFNDIFVSIAAAILLFAVGFIGQWIGMRTGSAIEGNGPSFLAPFLVAATSWALALFFTAKRRMARMSEPASGSVIARQSRRSPRMLG